MNNEETKILKEEMVDTSKSEGVAESKSQKGKIIAATGGGFAVGAVAGVVASAAASTPNDEHAETEEPQQKATVATNEETSNSEQEVEAEIYEEVPAPEQVILANDQGIRYAHVDANNFSDAFAQARAQVGAGGVFEYNGKLYGTYYADEWNNMSNQERADYQSRVNEIAPKHQVVTHDVAEHHETAPEVIPTDAEMLDVEPVNEEVRVLGVEAVQNENGSVMNVAILESGGDHALLVDVDNDGVMDVLLHDDNQDGVLQESEIYDVSDAGIEVNDLMQSQAAYDGEYLNATDDGMPDYVNDADSLMSI